MRVLQVHNRYKISGGEWTVFNQEYELLNMHHEVDQLIVENRERLRSFGSRLKLIFNTHYNRGSREMVRRRLREFRPDIMHVHNFFPILTPSIFDAAREEGVPSVLSLHNFRLIHPNGLMYHKGKIDTRSVTGSAYRCVPDGVYRDSVFQTAVSAHMIEHHRKRGTWNRVPSVFIALSDFSRSKFVEGGLPEERIFVKPNFIEDPLIRMPELSKEKKRGNTFLFVGRISQEKGIEDLVRCWMEKEIETELFIAGDGPLRQALEAKSRGVESIRWLGHIDQKEILRRLSESRALIFPTKCFEGQPLILLEAMSVGCPVITSSIGNPKNLIDDGRNGLHFKTGSIDELFSRIRMLSEYEEQARRMGRNARETYLEKYTPEANYTRMTEIYAKAHEWEKKLSERKVPVQ